MLAVRPARAHGGAPPLTAALEGLADGAQALADGDAAGAELAARAVLAALPPGHSTARAELTLGIALREQGRFAEAALVLARAAPGLEDRSLAEVARFERAQALFYSQDPGAAAIAFDEVARSATGTLARRARWRHADALLEAGSPVPAARAYQALISAEPGRRPSPAARLSLASALRASGSEAEAVSLYRALWIDEPADPAGRAAARALRSWREAGGPVPHPTPDQRLARAARFLELSHPQRVLRVLDRLDAASPAGEPATRSALLRARALVQLGRREQARQLAVRLQSSPAALPGTRLGAELVLARVAARSGRVDEAAARYRAIAASRELVPGMPASQVRELPEEARFLAAWLYYDAGHYARASRLLRAYVRANPRARRADDARWFEAWSLRRLGRREDARRALARLTRGPLLPASLYWQARLSQGRVRQRELYRRVLQEAPAGSWYALLASHRLARLGGAPPPPASTSPGLLPEEPPTSEPSDGLARAATLLAAGLRAEAVAALREAAAAPGAHARAAELAQLAEAAGDAELPFRMARDHLPQSRRALRWLYPLAFPSILPSSARLAGCDPELYLAIMRRESAFRPDARSGAGAIGLVQLIPPTAERLAAVYGLAPGRARQLELPEVSIPLGAAYLTLLAERFHDPAVALAAYNAGPAPAAAWARERAGMPLDDWVENIPFRETRRYVKNVTADAVRYRALWATGALSLDGGRIVPSPGEGVAF